MKKLLLFTLILALLCTGSLPAALANTVRVNNTLPTDKTKKIYASLQEAHDDGENVIAGDTLLVEGSITEYAGLTCVKKLVIIGPGYFLTQNSQNQANSLSATVQSIEFNPGSEGSVLIGLVFSRRLTSYSPRIITNNIAVIRCYLTNGINIGADINNLLIIQNYVERFGINVTLTGYSFGGVILKNNILAPNITIEQYATAPRIFTVVENNIFLGNVKVSANSFRNNIIVNKTATVEVTSGGTQNNLVSNNQIPATNGNQTYTESALFIGLEAANNSSDGQYKIKTESPYRTAGFNNIEPGIFGGNEPYVLSGIPPIPTIYDFQGDAVGSKQNGLNITIKARTNQ